MSAVVLIGAGFALLYHDVAAGLIRDWNSDANYSHGFFIVPIALYLAWRRRDRFLAAPHCPSAAGLALIVGSLAILTAGVLGSEVFLMRTSMIGTVAGSVLFISGWPRLRTVLFPIGFLLLMVPLPALVFNEIAFPLQLLASRAGEYAITVAGIPVLREGNILVLANINLEVAEACSGIRSLISLLTLGIVLGQFTETAPWVRTTIALATIPVAVVSNAARVAGVGIAAHRFGAVAAEGFLHEASGWLVFVVAFILIVGVQQLLVRLAQRLSPVTLSALPA